jgi:hypothetical protein
MCAPISPDLGLECDILLEVKGFIDEHGEWLIFKEEVFFLGTKNTVGVRVLVGTEVAGFNSAAVTMRWEDFGEQGREVVLDERDGDPGGTIKCGDVAMVGVWNPTRARVDTNKGSVVCGGMTSFDEVIDKVVNSHDDSRVIDFGDGGCAAAEVVDLLDELFSGVAEVSTDQFGDWLWVEQGDWERGPVDCVDLVTITTNKGVLFWELLECGSVMLLSLITVITVLYDKGLTCWPILTIYHLRYNDEAWHSSTAWLIVT